MVGLLNECMPMEESSTEETEHCSFTRIGPRLLVQRFKPEARFTQAILDEVAAARNRIIGDSLCALKVIIPKEIPVDPNATNTDHFTGERVKRRILALALVAHGDMMRSVSKFYFTWFPQPFPARVFDSEEEALAWLRNETDAAS
jgi:hypothetical protein